MTKVSVILTVYNKPQWLKECIDSVLRQTYPGWELIIMEDNSPDPDVKYILAEYAGHPNIAIYYSNVTEEDRFKTARYATLINKAVREMSTGKYITYLADDDVYFPWRLQAMVDKIESASHIDCVYGAQMFIDADGNIAGYRKTQGVLDNAWDKVDHNSVMHTRQVFDDAGGWEDNIGTWGGADSYFWREISNKGYKFYPLDDDMPNEAKRYHTDSVQWKMSNNVFFPKEI